MPVLIWSDDEIYCGNDEDIDFYQDDEDDEEEEDYEQNN